MQVAPLGLRKAVETDGWSPRLHMFPLHRDLDVHVAGIEEGNLNLVASLEDAPVLFFLSLALCFHEVLEGIEVHAVPLVSTLRRP